MPLAFDRKRGVEAAPAPQRQHARLRRDGNARHHHRRLLRRPKGPGAGEGRQFTSAAFTGLLAPNGIQISMDGRGSWRATTSLSNGCGGRSNTRRSICGPTTASARRVPLWAGIWISTIAGARTRALMHGRRSKPTSSTCRSVRQPELRRRCRGVTPVGLRPPSVTPRQRHTMTPTGRGSTYRGQNAVSTRPDASDNHTRKHGRGPAEASLPPTISHDKGRYHAQKGRRETAEVERLTIILPADMATVIRGAVAGSDYVSTSEVVRKALRDWKMKRSRNCRKSPCPRPASTRALPTSPKVAWMRF